MRMRLILAVFALGALVLGCGSDTESSVQPVPSPAEAGLAQSTGAPLPDPSTEAAPAQSGGVPLPPSENLVDDVFQPSLDLEPPAGFFPTIEPLDREPVVVFDDGQRRVELVEAFLSDGVEFWEVEWQSPEYRGRNESGFPETFARCVATGLRSDSSVDPFEAELLARGLTDPDEDHPSEILVEAQMSCSADELLLDQISSDEFDVECVRARLTDDILRAVLSYESEELVDLVIPCAR